MSTIKQITSKITAAAQLNGNASVEVQREGQTITQDCPLSILAEAVSALIGGGGGDTTPPGVSSMQVLNANPNQVVVVLNENSIVTTPGWSFRRNTTNWVISSVAGSGTTWTFTMATNAVAGETLDGSYNSGTGDTEDTAGNELVSFGPSTVTNGVSSGFDSDAETFFTNYSITDGTQRTAINEMVVDAKTESLWAGKILDWMPVVGATSAKHKGNLRRPTAPFELQYVGTPTHSSQGMVCGAGANGGEIDVVPADDMDIADFGIGIYAHDNVAVSTLEKIIMGCTGANLYLINLNPRWATNDKAYCGMTDSGGNINPDSTDSRGFWFMTRTANNVGKLFKNGVQVGTTFTATQSILPTTNKIGVGGGRTDSGTYFSAENTVSNFIRTTGLSDAEVAALSGIVNACETALGRNTY